MWWLSESNEQGREREREKKATKLSVCVILKRRGGRKRIKRRRRRSGREKSCAGVEEKNGSYVINRGYNCT